MSTSAQHHAISLNDTSRLLAQLIPSPGGLASSHCSTYRVKARA